MKDTSELTPMSRGEIDALWTQVNRRATSRDDCDKQLQALNDIRRLVLYHAPQLVSLRTTFFRAIVLFVIRAVECQRSMVSRCGMLAVREMLGNKELSSAWGVEVGTRKCQHAGGCHAA